MEYRSSPENGPSSYSSQSSYLLPLASATRPLALASSSSSSSFCSATMPPQLAGPKMPSTQRYQAPYGSVYPGQCSRPPVVAAAPSYPPYPVPASAYPPPQQQQHHQQQQHLQHHHIPYPHQHQSQHLHQSAQHISQLPPQHLRQQPPQQALQQAPHTQPAPAPAAPATAAPPYPPHVQSQPASTKTAALAWDRSQSQVPASATLAQSQSKYRYYDTQSVPSSASSTTSSSSSSSSSSSTSHHNHTLRKKCDLKESLKVESDYHKDLIAHMLTMEKQTQSDPSMIDTQPEIKWHMRPHLMDFLFKTHKGLHLNEETLFLAVNIVDRYSSQRIVFKRHYQLLGCTALWIASKYHDKKSVVPTLDELKHLCSKVYDSHMFTQMELHILNTLNWNIGHPTVDLFVDLCIGHVDSPSPYPATLRCAILYLCKVSTIHQPFLTVKASILASAAFKIATLVLTEGKEDLPPAGPSESQCMKLLLQYMVAGTPALACIYSSWEMYMVYQRMEKYHHTRIQQIQRQKELAKLLQQRTPPSSASDKAYASELTPATTPMTSKHSTPSSSSPFLHGQQQQQQLYQQHPGYMTPPFTPEEHVPSPQTQYMPQQLQHQQHPIAYHHHQQHQHSRLQHSSEQHSSEQLPPPAAAPALAPAPAASSSVPAQAAAPKIPHDLALHHQIIAQMPQAQNSTVFVGIEDYNEYDDEDDEDYLEYSEDDEEDDDDDDLEYADEDDDAVMDLDDDYRVQDVEVPSFYSRVPESSAPEHYSRADYKTLPFGQHQQQHQQQQLQQHQYY